MVPFDITFVWGTSLASAYMAASTHSEVSSDNYQPTSNKAHLPWIACLKGWERQTDRDRSRQDIHESRDHDALRTESHRLDCIVIIE